MAFKIVMALQIVMALKIVMAFKIVMARRVRATCRGTRPIKLIQSRHAMIPRNVFSAHDFSPAPSPAF